MHGYLYFIRKMSNFRYFIIIHFLKWGGASIRAWASIRTLIMKMKSVKNYIEVSFVIVKWKQHISLFILIATDYSASISFKASTFLRTCLQCVQV